MSKGFRILPSDPYSDRDKTIKSYYSSWRDFNRGNKDSKEKFAMIFTSFKDKYLSEIEGGPLKLYLFFTFNSANDSGDSWYSVEKLADFFNVGTRTVDKWIKTLVDKQLIYRDISNHRSATTYLLPYGTTLMKAMTTGTYPDDSQEIITDIISSLKQQKEIFGDIIGIYHIFQWKKGREKQINGVNARNIQWILYITKRPNGVLTGHYYELKNYQNTVLSKDEFEQTYFFESKFKHNEQPLLGVALNNEIDINSNNYEVIKGIIEQLAVIDPNEIPPSSYIGYDEIVEEKEDDDGDTAGN
ncbi:hypothetical protein GLW20_08585 [Virgibacillus halodenitrificans]|nr:hypothetical protein [Virgibacillus halodenitrificans]